MSNQKPVMGGQVGTVTQKPKNMKATMLRLLKYMKKSKYLIVLTVLTAIAGTVMQVWSPKMLGSATTVIFDGVTSGTGIDFTQLGTILLWVACLYVGRSCTKLSQFFHDVCVLVFCAAIRLAGGCIFRPQRTRHNITPFMG